jgi:DNA invertase Pin-like site-specific DNA recombinase
MLELRKLGIALRSATEATHDTPVGKFLATILSVVRQFDNQTRAERTLSGMRVGLRVADGGGPHLPGRGVADDEFELSEGGSFVARSFR